MTLTLFGKLRSTPDGKSFVSYTSRLIKKSTGEAFICSVKFNQSAGNGPKPEELPCNIDVERQFMSMSEKTFTRRNRDGSDMIDEQTGQPVTGISKTVWVRKWAPSAKVYVDTSMDDFESEADNDDYGSDVDDPGQF